MVTYRLLLSLLIVVLLPLGTDPSTPREHTNFPIKVLGVDDTLGNSVFWVQPILQPYFTFRQTSGPKLDGHPVLLCKQVQIKRGGIGYIQLLCEGDSSFELDGIDFAGGNK